MSKKHLDKAKRLKDDEYYTKYEDVEEELKHYKDYFKDKIIYCPCDSKESNFVKYFENNFNELELKELIHTCYQDGYDFRNQTDLRDKSDIIVTNAPFSLFREFIDWVGDKDCIILGPNNAPVYKNVFAKIKDLRLRLGIKYNTPMAFERPDGSEKKIAIGWYTTFPVRKVKPIKLKTKAENEANGVVYKKFDNYDAINVDRTNEIPSDYDGLMGVPITFLSKWIPEDYEIEESLINPKYTMVDGKKKFCRVIIKKNFEIIDCIGRYSVLHNEETRKAKKYLSMVDGKYKFSRVIIRRKK